jgi:PAS domain S-box-containing protein
MGWLLDIEVLKSVLPGLVTMKFNTALCFILSGIALVLLRTGPQRVVIGLSTIVTIIGLLTLTEYIFGWNLGLDEWLVHDLPTAVQTSAPGRMSAVTALNFCLLGGSLLLAGFGRQVLAQSFTLVVGFLALLAITGYVYDVQSFYQVFFFSSIALHTAITFSVLCLGIFFAYPERGLAWVIVADSAGGLLARRLLIPAIIVPLGVGWLRLKGEQAGLYGTEFGLALFALSNITVFFMLIFGTARTLNHVDMERREAMEALRQARDELERRVQERTAELSQTNRMLEYEVTEHEHTEETLAAERNLLRTLIDNIPDYIFLKDIHSRFAMANNAVLAAGRLTGNEQLVGKTDFDFFTPDIAQPFYDDEQQIIASGHALVNKEEASVDPKTGARLWFLTTKVPLKDQHGNITGILGISRNITGRKRADDKFRALLESAPDAMVIVNQQGSIEFVNSQTEKLFGYTREELLGQAIEMLVPEPFHNRHSAHRHSYIADPHARGMGIGLELFALRKDGSQFPVEISLGPIETEAGILIAAAVRDITDRKLAEKRAFELSIEREKVRLLGSFVQYSSHDLRTPLSKMNMALNIARRTDNALKRQEKLDAIESDILSMAGIIEEIQLLTNLESGLPVDMSPISLGNVIQGLPSHIQRIINEKNLSVHIAPENILIKGDAELLRHAYFHLLHNAVLYTPEQGAITVHTRREDTWGIIEVVDTGVGVENGSLETIFDFFTKINPARTSDGSGAGLGLAIVKKIIQIHNGKITVVSSPGQGSNFCLMLPLADNLESNPVQNPVE